MSVTGLPVFDETVHATNTWLHEITSRMAWEDRRKGYRLLRLCLHAVRDRLSVTEAAQFAAQLPMLMRGFFYEGWRPASVPGRLRTVDEFLAPIREAFSEDPAFDAEDAFREVIAVMRRHVSDGEIEDIRHAMPAEIRTLWDNDLAA
jgi:uncharacterized protein (DUF2267 family)